MADNPDGYMVPTLILPSRSWHEWQQRSGDQLDSDVDFEMADKVNDFDYFE